MRFENLLLEMLLEGKIEDTLDRHPTIPEHIKQDYLRQIPANNAQHLDWVLHQHSKGNISPEHNINEILTNFNKVKDKLDKKQIHQYKSVDELHSAILPHIDSIQKSKKEKQEEGTKTLYSSPTMTIRQHHNYESCVNAGFLPKNNNSGKEKAEWCISVGGGGGAAHYGSYTDNGFHPVYSIEHHHPNGTSSKHMFVYDYNKTQENQELRDEHDYRPGFNDYGSTRPDLLDHYSKKFPEILKTPISKFFNEEGRNEYENEAMPLHKHIKNLISSIPKNGMTDDEYMHYFKEGQKERHGSLHNALAKVTLSDDQLNHLIEHGNEGSKDEIAKNKNLTESQFYNLANTSNMITHFNLLNNPNLDKKTYNRIASKCHTDVLSEVLYHKYRDSNTVDNIINRKNINDFSNLVDFHSDLLKQHHIDKIIDKISEESKGNLITHNHKLLSKDHIFKLTDNKKLHSKIINYLGDKLDEHHISNIIDNTDVNGALNIFRHNIMDKFNENHIHKLLDKNNHILNNDILYNFGNILDSNHIDRLLNTKNEDINTKILYDIPSKLEPHHIDKLLQHSKGINSSIIPLINDKFREYKYESKSHILNKVKEMKNNDDTDWMKFTKVHPMMGLSNVDKFKVDYNLTEINTPIDIKMNDEELHNELHPWVNKQIDKNLEPHEAARTLAKLAHVINKEQTEKLLNKVGSYQNIFINLDSSGKKINKHVADAILDHSIKHNNFQSIKGIIHHLDLNNLEPRHEEYLKNHSGISDLDSKGVFAKHVVDKAIKDNDIYKLRTLSKSYNRHYASLASDGVRHLLNNMK